ncbi:hypothetical protein EVA_11836 [gut metagenome]|uniref:Uncharacterized protein n=1 Tax=gut metagenome TaxID=749906 RepID=J9FYM9_9ZZZZ
MPTAFFAVRVMDTDLAIFCTYQYNEMTGGGEVSWPHTADDWHTGIQGTENRVFG